MRLQTRSAAVITYGPPAELSFEVGTVESEGGGGEGGCGMGKGDSFHLGGEAGA